MQRHVSIRIMRSADPNGLADMVVYASAADGQITGADREFYGDDLAALTAGMEHQVVNYKSAGIHARNNFREELAPAWKTVRPNLS
ncbi:hypothetical protein EAH68_09520 [Corynebacterium hylobatis]|uniref:Uncharacterized protein n=1 Tax=Corynebacterium hylobatis TaxID=1859290 RepID=A0A3R9ZDR2_9CORY|nr:hypothetical protein [Corynebacterium hylobatis]RSZ62370.1 hypothetical protein EAH68_09520 [Corynebacterium hylobatis]